jgi:hypothetical protein
MNEEQRSRVESLQDTLYSRTRYKDPLGKRSPVRELDPPAGGRVVNENWQSSELSEILTRERKAPEVTPFMKKFFIFALFFFAATVVLAGVIFMGGTNFISSKNVDIAVLGPTTASAGEIIELGVTVENKNNTELETVSFSVQYPQGARDATDTGRALTFTKEELGSIRAGDEAVKNISFVLIGSTGEVKEIKFSVEYKIKGSNATFYKDKIYEVTIGNAPMTISVESPSTVTSGDTFMTKIKLSLSSTEVLRNVMLRAEYPYGYSVVSTSPEAVVENNVWALGDLSPGAEKVIEIRGRLTGENRDERTFRLYAGVSDNGSFSPDFKSVIVTAQNTVAIERPSIGLAVSFNGETSPIYIAPADRTISTSVRFQNNLPERVINPRLVLDLAGTALNKETIQIYGNGVYNPANNTITWNLSNSAGASELMPGEGGVINFNFASLPQAELNAGGRDITLRFTLTGVPASSGNRPITVAESRTVRIASQVTLTSKGYYSIGPFKNSGPIPPKIGEETTYTVVWNIGNTQDDIVDAKVTARLGVGVKWLAANSILSEAISYDEASNTITWNLTNLSSGSGFSISGREAAFQLGLTPTNLQQGTAPALVSNITFTGRDAVTGREVTVTNPPVTTRLSNDPAFIQGDDIVVR